ncbi:hypothetical protein CAPTEDRAFT_100083 [Capitella teleta]|uniref:G-protein coupled receptors family 1 profile domain-containing protein n=1 Tax=Capitella teleta TaxID=283909 RepID=R7TFU4_CAPTE|nr:hypothetical protein CAPTEDRAFT_100083 [Capitella teleta]|eukprot:ELT92342.1 hypothetical protein CAPTEDRAFT_100083 [Capitella teleta]
MDNTTYCCGELNASTGGVRQGVRVEGHSAMNIATFFISTVGLIGNLGGLITFTHVRTFFRGKVRVLVIHQCFVDMLAALLLILHTIFDNSYRLLDGLAGEIQCKIWLTKLFLWSTFLTSTLNLCCITLERYLAVVWPIKYRQQWRQKSFYPFIVGMWLLAMIFNTYKIPTTIVVNGTCQVYGNWSSTFAKQAVGIVNLLVYFLGPFALFVYCYHKIAQALGNNRVFPSTARDVVKDQSEINRLKSRKGVIRTLMYMSAMFVFCWIWNQIYFLLLNLGVDLDFANPFYHFTVITVTSNCSVNPFIYLVQFRAIGIIKKSFNTRAERTNRSMIDNVSTVRSRGPN